MGFEVLIGNMNTLGFYDFFIPFIMFVAIVFGLLQKYKVFGDDNTQSIDGIIAISIGFFVINYTPIGLYFSTIFAIGASIIGVILIGIIMLGMFGIDAGKHLTEDEGGKKLVTPILGAVGAIVAIIFFFASGLYERYVPDIGFAITEETLVTIAFLGVFALIAGMIVKKS